VTSRTTTRTWGDPAAESWARYGRVQNVRETVRVAQGDPAGGAVAGAAIGGLFGALVGGHSHHGYYHPSGAGAVFGAATGAMVGAAASQSGEQRTYEVLVAFEDGGSQTFIYRSWPPFRPGDAVQQTQYGLSPIQSGPPSSPPSSPPPGPPPGPPAGPPPGPPVGPS
jgi:outer membrane lipoprotein SlyB